MVLGEERWGGGAMLNAGMGFWVEVGAGVIGGVWWVGVRQCWEGVR